ncbi:MAG: PKD domain-containing protein [Chitinophagaceae bacterium]
MFEFVSTAYLKKSFFYTALVFLLSCFAKTLIAQAPTITSFSPNPACQGEQITIKGSNFTGATSVVLGTLSTNSITVVDDNTITANVPDVSTSGNVSVTNASGTTNATGSLTIKPAPIPDLIHVGATDPFTNCNGNAVYQLTVSNSSSQTVSGSSYSIDWGDGTTAFSQNDWPIGSTTTHTYNSQGYFTINFTITPPNGCKRTGTKIFYNGQNPIGSFTTSTSTTGLCTPSSIQFQIGNWFNNSAGTTYIVNFGDGTPLQTLNQPLSATNITYLLSHTYNTSSCPTPDYTATLQAKNGCFTTTYTLNQIVIRKKPTVDFTVPGPNCVNTQICFVNNTINGYSGNTCSTTTNFTWDFGDGTSTVNSVQPCHTYATAGTYTVTLSANNISCGSDIKSKQITVLATSPLPTVTSPVTYCKGQAATPLTATGNGLLWYTSATGGVGSATAPTPSTANVGSVTYYVSQTIGGSCESQRVPITVTVNALPTTPTVTSPVQLCLNQSASPLTATGSGLLWYTTATGGAGSSTAPTPSTTAVGSTTYYVSQTTTGCEGPRAAIVVNVNDIANAPVVVSPLTYCQNQTAPALTATGSGLLWYTSATGGTGSSTAPVPSTTTPGTTTWYVSQSSSCGESPRASITVTVNAAPSATISYANTNLCNVVNSASTPNLPVQVTLSGTTGGVFSVTPATGLQVNTTTGEINPSGATAGTYTIRYSIAGSGGCANFSTTATVTVNSSPTASVTYPAAVCTSTAAATPQVTGSNGGSFSSTTGLTINATTGVINPGTSTPGNYVITYTIQPSGPCPGFTTTANITITQAPSATISYSITNLCNAPDNAQTPNPPVLVTLTGTAGGSFSVVPATGLTVNASNGTITPAGATPGQYTINYTILGTGGCPNYTVSAKVIVDATPAATISYPASICTSNNSTPVVLTGTTGGSYSSTSGLSINATTGAIAASQSTPGTYTITYEIAPSAPCPGFKTTANVTIVQAPSASIAYSPTLLCNVTDNAQTPNPPIAATLTGTTGGSYTISPATGLLINAATGTITPSGATPGQYTITYTVPASGPCASINTITTITISKAPTATINYAGSPYCKANSTPQTVTATGNPGGVYSAGSGLSINPTTGAINPSLSTPGVYTVKYTIAASAPCPGFETSTTVQIDDSPVLSFANPSQSICSGGTASYTPISTVPNTVYSWALVGALPAGVSGTSTGSAAGNNAVISLSFINTGSNPQTLTIRVTPTNPSSNPCAGAPYNITIQVNPIPPALQPDTFHFCMGATPVALTATPAAGNTVKWYDANFVLQNAAPVIGTNNPAQYVYYATQTNSYGCESPRTKMPVIVHPTAKITSASYTNPTSCGLPSGSIILNVLDLNGNPIPNEHLYVHYNKFQTSFSMFDSTNANGQIKVPLSGGTYSNIYVETSGCLSQKIPDVFVLTDPNPPAQPVAGYNPPICSETILNLTASSATSTQTGIVNYVWAGPAFGPNPDTTTNTVVSFPSASMNDAGTYVVYAIQNNCVSSPASFQVQIKQSPSKPIISTRNPLCIGDALVLQAYSSMPGNGAINYEWKGPGAGFPVNTSNAGIPKVVIQDAGIYTVTVTSPQTGCVTTKDTLIQIGDYPIVKFAQDSLTLPAGYLLKPNAVIINATLPGVLPMKKYEWTPSADVKCNDSVCGDPIITIKNNVCYNLKVTNIYGCSDTAGFCVKVLCESSQLFIPNAFTPTGNIAGNTKLTVRASGIASVKSFRIFNRWGRLLFERTNFPPNSPEYGWDGRINGKLADPGVYIYIADVICENGIPYSYKGNVTLL